jgi:porin
MYYGHTKNSGDHAERVIIREVFGDTSKTTAALPQGEVGMGRWPIAALAIFGVLGPTAAMAQEAPGRTATPGILSDEGQKLDDMGIRIRAQLVNEFADNPEGGVKQGSTDAGQFQIGASVDLQKMVGLPGGTFHFTVIHSFGDSLAKNDVGDFIKTQEVYKNAYDLWRLSIFAYEQKLLDNRLDILVGRLGSSAFYGRLSNTCYFESGLTCGVPQVLNSEANITFPTSATWGGNVKYRFSPMVSVQAGAFEVNSFIQQTNGLDFSTASATGVSNFAEMQIGDYDITKNRYAWDVKIGGYDSTAPFNDPYYNTKGQSLAINGGTAMLAKSQRHGIYAMGESVIWRPDPKKDSNVSAFGGYVQSLEYEEVARYQLYGGLTARNIIPGRAHDIVSGTFSYFNLTDREVDFLNESREKLHGAGLTNPNEYGLEVDYSALVFNSARVSPNLSYIINPDNSNFSKINFVPKNAIVIGLKVTFNFAGWLGLPLAPNLSD